MTVRGRPIVLHTLGDLSAPGCACGVLLLAATTDHIFYDESTSGLHRTGIILHEVGHLLAEHRTRGESLDYLALRLMPDLDPAMVRGVLGRGVLGRGGYRHPEEAEAELTATSLWNAPTVVRPPMPYRSGIPLLRRYVP